MRSRPCRRARSCRSGRGSRSASSLERGPPLERDGARDWILRNRARYKTDGLPQAGPGLAPGGS